MALVCTWPSCVRGPRVCVALVCAWPLVCVWPSCVYGPRVCMALLCVHGPSCVYGPSCVHGPRVCMALVCAWPSCVYSAAFLLVFLYVSSCHLNGLRRYSTPTHLLPLYRTRQVSTVNLAIIITTFSLVLSGVNFVSGCVGGAVATVTSFPFDVLRTRMIGQGEPKVANPLL